MPARNWKWRMHGAAVYLADQINNAPPPHLILLTDMIDVALFRSCLGKEYVHIPCCTYFHENQITYPWSPDDPDPDKGRDLHYAFINFSTALVSDKVYFNSPYHYNSFFNGLERYLNRLPDFQLLNKIKLIKAKSAVLPLGVNLSRIRGYYRDKNYNDKPIILWNHRWEYDKNPNLFFESLIRLKAEDIHFRLIVLGEKNNHSPEIFKRAKQDLKDETIHWGYAASEEEYLKLLVQADILPVCSMQDFFGISVVEAIYAGVIPLLPNRLNYPSLIPLELHQQFIYAEGKFYDRLKMMVVGGKTYRFCMDQLRDHVAQYDWNQLAPLYDEELGQVVIQFRD